MTYVIYLKTRLPLRMTRLVKLVYAIQVTYRYLPYMTYMSSTLLQINMDPQNHWVGIRKMVETTGEFSVSMFVCAGVQ